MGAGSEQAFLTVVQHLGACPPSGLSVAWAVLLTSGDSEYAGL